MVNTSERPAAPNAAIGAFALAIAFAEGSPAAWNNPGDLTKSFGFPNEGPQNKDGVLKFATAADGWNALYAQLQLIASGKSRYCLCTTLCAFGQGYAGDCNWANNVASQLPGVSSDTTLGEILCGTKGCACQ